MVCSAPQRRFPLFKSHRAPFNLEIPQELFEIRLKEVGCQMLGILRIKPKHSVVSFSGDMFPDDALIRVVDDLKRQRVCSSEIRMHEAALGIDGQTLNAAGNRNIRTVAAGCSCQRGFPALPAEVIDQGLGGGLRNGSTG